MNICFICKKDDDDPIKYGEFKETGDIRCHYFCLVILISYFFCVYIFFFFNFDFVYEFSKLLSSSLPQNGGDNEGILGFLEPDIKKEAQKGRRVSCVYCKQKSATILCRYRNCRRTFHQVCGYQNKALFQFKDEFKSFCHEHIEKHPYEAPTFSKCYCCLESMDPNEYNAATWIPTCGCKSAYTHLYCMRQWATHSGYAFRCACLEKDEDYVHKLLMRNVFIPQRDATWELTKSAYRSLLIRPNDCSAEYCLNPQSRSFSRKRHMSNWYMHICQYCGGAAIHKKCWKDYEKGIEFCCDECNIKNNSKEMEKPIEIEENGLFQADEKVFADIPCDRKFRKTELEVIEISEIDNIKPRDRKRFHDIRMELLFHNSA